MSKAFTKDDDGAGFEPPKSRKRSAARLTAHGARILREALANASPAAKSRIRELLEGAEIIAPAGGDRAALGARVRMRSDRGERTVVLVTADEVGHVPRGVGVATALGRAMLGAREGDEVTVEGGREGDEDLEVLEIEWPE